VHGKYESSSLPYVIQFGGAMLWICFACRATRESQPVNTVFI
jgi:hypothetical protein